MTTGSEASGSVNSTDVSSGSAENSGPNPNPTKDVVAYDTHRRLLDEKKKIQQERDALAAEKAAAERKALEEKGEYQKIAALDREKLAMAEQKAAELENRFLQGRKVKAFLGAVGNGIDEKFYGFLPLDEIVIDPDTQEVNATSVAKAADNFKKAYPELLKPKPGVTLPNVSPAGNDSGMIAESQWKKLKTSAEMDKWKNKIKWGE